MRSSILFSYIPIARRRVSFVFPAFHTLLHSVQSASPIFLFSPHSVEPAAAGAHFALQLSLCILVTALEKSLHFRRLLVRVTPAFASNVDGICISFNFVLFNRVAVPRALREASEVARSADGLEELALRARWDAQGFSVSRGLTHRKPRRTVY